MLKASGDTRLQRLVFSWLVSNVYVWASERIAQALHFTSVYMFCLFFARSSSRLLFHSFVSTMWPQCDHFLIIDTRLNSKQLAMNSITTEVMPVCMCFLTDVDLSIDSGSTRSSFSLAKRESARAHLEKYSKESIIEHSKWWQSKLLT